MIETQTPNSPGWWLKRLVGKLDERRNRYDRLDAYFRGENGIPVHADKSVRQAYQRLMAMSRTNFAELIVEAVRERMKPVGFRTGAQGDEGGDGEAWRIWQANALDADAALVHRASLSLSMAYVIVGGPDPDIDAPLITPEDPREVIVEHDPRRRRKARAGLKVFSDDTYDVERAYLFLPGFVAKASRRIEQGAALDASRWEWDDNTPEMLPTDMRDVVPIVAFPNKADMSGRPSGEYESHLGMLDRINFTILTRLEIATLQAFRQRAIKGVPDTDAQGNPIDYDDIFAADPGALWLLPATAELWESGQVDLGPIRQAIRDDVQDVAAVTRTPLFYLTPDAANGSAEGASLAREGLVFKTADRIVEKSDPWEDVMSLAFRFAGDAERASRRDMEILWAPPERFSLSERYDAASKAQAAGVPWHTVMTDILQFSPQQVERMAGERATDALINAPLPNAGQ